jgi:MFS transporter, ACS family, solute carrier family 17 (sodium-dependent inorganic phosphate cotransporter), other
LPGGILAERWGGKYLLSLGILSTAFFTLISPLAARAGSGWLIAVRVLMGLGEVNIYLNHTIDICLQVLFFQGTTFPALNTLLAKWIPLRERGFWGTVVFSGKF